MTAARQRHRYLQLFKDSLLDRHYLGIDGLTYEVIVVDNGSDPDQRVRAEDVAVYGPEFRLISLDDAPSSPTVALNRARTQVNLADLIDIMGLQEQFEPFCADLEAAFGWDLGDPVFIIRTKPANASAAPREQSRAENAYDVALYDFAVDLWNHRYGTWSGRGEHQAEDRSR